MNAFGLKILLFTPLFCLLDLFLLEILWKVIISCRPKDLLSSMHHLMNPVGSNIALRPPQSIAKWIILFSVCTCVSCTQPGGAPVPLPEFVLRPTYSWVTASPSTAGLDSSALANHLKTNAGINSILIIKDSLLVFEYYGGNFFKENDFDIRSASKSFISALVGIAIGKGVLDSLKQPILSFFPEFDTAGMDPRKRLITIEHLLTMRAGFDYVEGDDYSHLYTPDAQWAHVTLGLPLKFDPGSAFSYATPQTHLLSVILAKQNGLSTYEFAETFLFQPMGISVRDWYKDPQGFYYGGTGMGFTARDFARLGYLFLKGGFVDGKRIVAESWIEESRKPRNLTDTQWGDLNSVNYGYQWWTATTGADSMFMAAGYAGQFCFVIPGRSLVVVSTTDSDVPIETANTQELVVIDFLVNRVLPDIQ